MIDWLDYNGFTVVTKPVKEFTDASGRRKVKGNMDIELAVDAMELAPFVGQMVLFSGDGDFRSLVEAIQRKGVRVSVVSTVTTQPPMVADDLRRQADEFIDLVLDAVANRPRHERAGPARPAGLCGQGRGQGRRAGRDNQRGSQMPAFLERKPVAPARGSEPNDEAD